MLVMTSLLVAFTNADSATVQTQIEREIKALLGEQLAPGEFFVYALVTTLDAGKVDDAATDNILPYTSLNVPKGIIQEILERNLPKDALANLKIDVTLGFDDRLPEDKRRLMEDVVRKRFGFDGEGRTLTVETLKLVTPRIAEAERYQLEKVKMESEQARLALETERSKLEVKQKELELTSLQAKIAAPPPVAPQLPTTVTPPVADTPAQAQQAQQQVPQLGPQLAIFKDFQLTAMALVLGIVLVVAILVGGSFFIKGLAPLSSAIETVGSSIETAAKTGGGSQTQVTTVAADSDGRGSGGGEGGGEAGMPSVVQGVPMSESAAKANEEFVKQVQDKIEVLSKERNFNFFRIFSDMLDQRATLPLAAAILVSLDAATSRQIVGDLSAEDIAKLRNFLGSDGGLIKAKELRTQALTDFYGRIAMEEFLNSPLMDVKDLRWLTKMTTKDMAKFIVNLSDGERPVFLACLSPERVKRLLGAVSEDDKDVLLRSLAIIDTVTEDRIRPVIDQISKKMSFSMQSKQAGPRLVVDSAKYIASVAADLSEAEQTKLFQVLQDKAGLVEGIKEHFIPFASITSLPKELVLEIFGDKSDPQIAQIVFDSAEDVRKVVLLALPEIRAESVKDELRALDENKFYDKRNRKLSLRLQKEISKYLQRLYAEGLLTFQKKDGDSDQATQSDETAA